MVKLIKFSAILCAAVGLALSSSANATPVSTVDIVRAGYGANEIVTIWGGGQEDRDVYAGVYMLDKSDGIYEGNIWLDGPIGAFCTELTELPPQTTLTYDVLPVRSGPVPFDFLGGPMGGKADYITELWGGMSGAMVHLAMLVSVLRVSMQILPTGCYTPWTARVRRLTCGFFPTTVHRTILQRFRSRQQ